MPPFTRRKLISTGLVAGGLLVGGVAARLLSSKPQPLRIVTRKAAALGSQVHITIHHHNRQEAEHAIDEALALLDQIEDLLSIYRPKSQLSELNREGELDRPHPFLHAVLATAIDMSRRTGGAFDCTIQPLWAAHAEAHRQGHPLDDKQLEAARALVDWRHIDWSPQRIAFKKPGMAITFNGIAQGFAADRVRDLLAARGITCALIDVGELSALGNTDGDGSPWRVGIQHPRQADAYIALTSLDQRSMATSGDYESSFSADHSSHHILNPETGRSPTELSSVTVIAPSAMQADALSTGLFVLGPEMGSEVVRSMENVDAMFILKSGRTLTTAGFPRAG